MYNFKKTPAQIILMLILLTQLTSGLTNEVKHQNVSVEEQTKDVSTSLEARGKEEKDMMSRILPMMIIPFMISTGIIPMMLISLKFMLMKSALIGKLAVILLVLNMFRGRQPDQGGVSNHDVHLQDMHMAHYGYSGGEEYGAYVNGKKRSSR
ncbi:uncharacterized protein LOC135129696 [Zophobas morio]|uniref:uncharacterized protein LOC135129696 n=1 Tax=Zophobas morio TaxID=2755281 RepID=UPI00308320B7